MKHTRMTFEEIEHYLIRSHEWFVFLAMHPEVRTKKLLKKLYNQEILSAGHFYLLNQNTDENAESILNNKHSN